MQKFLLSFLVGLFLLPATIDAYGARTTRDLVFEDEEETVEAEASDTKTLAMKSTILLTRDGETTTVLPSHQFKSGDKVKLVFTPSIDGYVYWMAKGSSGQYSVLFPNHKAGSDNAVARNQEYTVPTKGSFRFDDTPGNEELLCILSETRVPEIDDLIAASSPVEEKNIDKLQASNDTPANDAPKSSRTTRDLVFEDEDEEDVNTKSQELPQGEPLVSHFILTHN